MARPGLVGGHAQVGPGLDVGDGELPGEALAQLGGDEGGVGEGRVQAVARPVGLQLQPASVETSVAEEIVIKRLLATWHDANIKLSLEAAVMAGRYRVLY